jgi:hypothetical protein
MTRLATFGCGARFNRIQAIVSILRLEKGVIFLREYISLKNWTKIVLLRHDTSVFKRTCFLITLKHVPGGLYTPNDSSELMDLSIILP